MNRLAGKLSDVSVSQAQLAEALNLSRPRINQLIDEGIVLRDEESKTGAVVMLDSLHNYYLSKNVSGGGVDFWKEKGMHERAKRQLTELKVREREGELYEAEVVEAVMSEQLTNFRTKLTAIPAKFATRLEGKSRSEIYNALTAEIEDCLEELAKNYKSADFTADAEIEFDDEESPYEK